MTKRDTKEFKEARHAQGFSHGHAGHDPIAKDKWYKIGYKGGKELRQKHEEVSRTPGFRDYETRMAGQPPVKALSSTGDVVRRGRQEHEQDHWG